MSYSSVLQAHIDVQQGLQKVSAYTEDMFSPDEIDLQLSRQQEQLVEEIVTKRFQDLQTGLDYIRPLIVKNYKLKPIVPFSTEAIYEENMVYGVLPADYYHLINDRSMVVRSSQSDLCKDLSEYKLPANQTNFIEYTATVQFPEPENTSAPYYCKTTITINTTAGVITKTLPEALNTLRSSKSWFTVVNYILDSINIPGIQIYWENYRSIYQPKSFIFVTLDATVTTVTVSFQTSLEITTVAGSATAAFLGTVYKYYNVLAVPHAVYQQVDNTLTEADEFYTQNTNVFFKPSSNNPKTQLANGFLLAYEQISYLISDLYVDYVRKPRQVSLSLNQNFELVGDAQRIVVDRVIETLKLYIENPAYQAVLTHNQTRNQL